MSTVLHIPSRAERWPLLERLGRGGAGETWRALRQSALLSDEVCVKLPLSALDPEDRRAVLEEARVLSRVRHANVVALLDVVEDQRQRPVLVLELVHGTDLKRVAAVTAGVGLPWPVIATIGRCVALALGALGRAFPGGAAHRDVSPHNILLSREGEVKLADFGIARPQGRERWTRSGRLKGKCGYVAPERVRGEPGDAKSDVFSLGIVLHELATGQRPFGGSNLAQQLDAIVRGERAAPSLHALRLPRDAAELLDHLLAHEPLNRLAPDAVARQLAEWSDVQLTVDVVRDSVRRARGPGLASTRPRQVVPSVSMCDDVGNGRSPAHA